MVVVIGCCGGCHRDKTKRAGDGYMVALFRGGAQEQDGIANDHLKNCFILPVYIGFGLQTAFQGLHFPILPV